MPFAIRLIQNAPNLMSGGEGLPHLSDQDRQGLDAKALFASLTFEDPAGLWENANLRPLCYYLRGNRSLQCPDAWKQVFPSAI